MGQADGKYWLANNPNAEITDDEVKALALMSQAEIEALDGASAGTVAAGLSSGGQTGSTTFTANVEEYDGSSWTEVNNLTTARQTGGGGGPSTSGLVFGGSPPPSVAKTENWDGTSWTEVADLATARYGMGAGSNSPGTTNIAFGGYTGSHSNATEEWDQPTPLAIKTFTAT